MATDNSVLIGSDCTYAGNNFHTPVILDCAPVRSRRKLGASFTFVVIFLLFCASAYSCEDWLAKVVSVEGGAETSTSQGNWQALQQDQLLCPGDRLRVLANSRASLYLRNNTFMRVGENSVLNFPLQKNKPDYWLDIQEGIAHFMSRIVNRFEVSTPYVNAVVEGTEFTVEAQPTLASVAVLEGKVKVKNDRDASAVETGQQLSATSRSSTLTRLLTPSGKNVEWAIYYPPLLTLENLTPDSTEEAQSLRALSQLSQQNRADLAIQNYQSNWHSSPNLSIAYAALLLSVGKTDRFETEIIPLLSGTQSGNAWALQSIADAARNRPERALTAAKRAVKQAPNLASSYIALSYAQQSSLQLEEAIKSARMATQVEPANTLAWLRLSELYLMQADIVRADDALHHAESMNNSSRFTQAKIVNARGFIQLFQLDIDGAIRTFEETKNLDAGAPQTHLGLGLALLRKGEQEKGRQQLEYAAMMDPLRSSTRSYLGRAYFSEKRDRDALTQWDLAKMFDANDPTPYFYTGIQQLFSNKPIDATKNLETAKTLNNNRAIYRSETLLESDAASRSAALARAYNETGYEQGVLLNGWDALQHDPTNAEGHRLLADYFAKNNRHESARASTLLQSQLWQPLNAYNLQPQLNETNLSIVEGSGPTRPGLNEYHPLLIREGSYAIIDGYGGSDGTWGDDVTGSLLKGPLSVSLGQYHLESDGWRKNAEQTQDIYNGFVQWQITPSTSVQAEHREMNWDRGYLAPTLAVGENGFSSQEDKRTTDRIGFHHQFSASNALVLSAIKQSLTAKGHLEQDLGPTQSNLDADSVSTEAQWVLQSGLHQLLMGAGIFDSDIDDSFEQSIVSDLDGIPYELAIIRDAHKSPDTKMGYAEYHYSPGKELNLGVGGDFYSIHNDITTLEVQTESILGSDSSTTIGPTTLPERRTRWRPRMGAAYKFAPEVEMRAAYFTSISRNTIIDQSLAPVQFFGFINDYDDLEGSESNNYAFAIDASSGQTHYGVSAVTRRLQIPYEGVNTIDFAKQTQDIAEVYLNLTPTPKIAASVNTRWTHKQLLSQGLLAMAIKEINQYQIPFRMIFFGENACSLGVEEVYYQQDSTTADNQDHTRDHAWVSNAYIRYRFDRRLGNITLGVNNATNKKDVFLGFSEKELAFYPARFWYTTINLNF